MSNTKDVEPNLTIGDYRVQLRPAQDYGGKSMPGTVVLAGTPDISLAVGLASSVDGIASKRTSHDEHKSRSLNRRELRQSREMGRTTGGKPRLFNRKEAIIEAKATGLPLAWACALLQKESEGRNVFGHDPGNDIQGGVVTKEEYLQYKANLRGGQPAQGVGPTQLTYPPLQRKADAIGGCDDVSANMHVGFEYFRQLRAQHGDYYGPMFYNTGGQVNDAGKSYARTILKYRKHWAARLRKAGRMSKATVS